MGTVRGLTGRGGRLRRVAAAAGTAALLGGGLVSAADPAAADGGVLYVAAQGSDTGGCTEAAPCATISYALAQAVAGDVIQVGPGYYYDNLVVAVPVSIVGAGWTQTVVDGLQKQAVLINLARTVSVSGLTLADGKGGAGGGVENVDGTATLSDVRIDYNSAGVGGGVANEDGNLVISDSTIAGNTAVSAGGGIDDMSRGGTILQDDTIADNTLTTSGYGEGAGIFGWSLAMDDVTVSGNSAPSAASAGGGIYLSWSDVAGLVTTTGLSGEHDTVADNQAGSGGGIAIQAPYAGLAPVSTLAASIVADNRGGNCSGVTLTGSYDLEDDAAAACGITAAAGGVTGQDPDLAALSSGGDDWTRPWNQELAAGSPAHDAIPAASSLCQGEAQNGVARDYAFAGGCDIGSDQLTVDATLSPATLNFGTLPVGQGEMLSVTVTNTGTTTLYPHGLPSPTTGDFEYLGGTCEGEASFIALPPGASCQFYLSFTPTAQALYWGSFSFADNADAQHPEQTIALSGAGIRSGGSF